MSQEIDYRQAGVNIEAGEAAVERIKGLARSTAGPEVLQGLGGFAGLFALNTARYREPVLVAGCDGVGTKLKLAFAAGRHDTVGIDCVAMCVNDILVQGAEPLFFLDYLAVGKLDPEQVEKVVAGVAQGCRLAGCALLGGEMAEMPGFYPAGEYDLAGFAVGVVEREQIIDGSRIGVGDTIIGLASTGLHSNGFSLVRKVLLERAGLALEKTPPGLEVPLIEELLKPTRIYVRAVLPLMKKYTVKGAAHITGGGLPGNLPRILPRGLQAIIREGSWPVPPVFSLIQGLGPVRVEEMYHTFNMGIGFVLIVPPEQAEAVLADLQKENNPAWIIGEIAASDTPYRFVPGPASGD
ncbi:MAG TPA: phosphoribosylformylglycinamidine cyclo-ligase [Bacillota bacterium]|nr:phosphoribosylformylglycinamidine cyclo-ligase [Bacillota bacterium]